MGISIGVTGESVNPGSARRERLDVDKIVAGGIALADEEGVDGLTMRRLAEQLGFKVMALYNHVANKDELLRLMVDAVGGSIPIPPDDEEPMRAVRVHAIATRAAFVRHPWAPVLWQRYLPGPNRIDHMEALLRTINRSGLPPDVAHHGFHAVTNHVLGYTLQELAMDFGGADGGADDGVDDAADDDAAAVMAEFLATVSTDRHPHTIAHVHQHMNGDTASSFELVLDLILNGLVGLADAAEDR